MTLKKRTSLKFTQRIRNSKTHIAPKTKRISRNFPFRPTTRTPWTFQIRKHQSERALTGTLWSPRTWFDRARLQKRISYYGSTHGGRAPSGTACQAVWAKKRKRQAYLRRESTGSMYRPPYVGAGDGLAFRSRLQR